MCLWKSCTHLPRSSFSWCCKEINCCWESMCILGIWRSVFCCLWAFNLKAVTNFPMAICQSVCHRDDTTKRPCFCAQVPHRWTHLAACQDKKGNFWFSNERIITRALRTQVAGMTCRAVAAVSCIVTPCTSSKTYFFLILIKLLCMQVL